MLHEAQTHLTEVSKFCFDPVVVTFYIKLFENDKNVHSKCKLSQNQINISRTFLSMIDRVDTNCSKTIATVSGKDSNSVNKEKDCKE